MRTLARLLREIKDMQAVPFRFEHVATVSDFVASMSVLSSGELFQQSKLIEAGGAEEKSREAERRIAAKKAKSKTFSFRRTLKKKN